MRKHAPRDPVPQTPTPNLQGVKKVALVSHMWVTKAIITTAMGILPKEQVLLPPCFEL